MSRSILRTVLAGTLSTVLLCSSPGLAPASPAAAPTSAAAGTSTGTADSDAVPTPVAPGEAAEAEPDSLTSGSSLLPGGSSASSLGSSTGSGDNAGSEDGGGLLGSTNSLLQALVFGSSQSPTSSGVGVNGALGLLNLLGLYEMQFSGPLLSSEKGYPFPTDSTISTPAVLSRETDDRAPRLERWKVASPAMQRVVEVQVMRPADAAAAAPMVYLLDGIGGNKTSSGWINGGEAEQVFGEENATVVMPLGAAASMYSDWEQPDPALGTIRWETFIVEELAPLLEAEADLNFNGRRAIGGLSMGATGAVHLANSRPEFFDGVIGISGCYSTLDPVGRQTVNLIVGSRGGDVNNMWGPYGSETWVEHDVTANPEGLRDMAVYLSVANGAATAVDGEVYAGDPFFNMIAGVALERGALECTYNLDRAMRDRGMDHQVVEYKSEGLHNWENYNAQLQPGWEAIRHALYRD